MKIITKRPTIDEYNKLRDSQGYITAIVSVPLYDIIQVTDIDEFNDLIDELITPEDDGVDPLSDLSYTVVGVDPDPQKNSVLIEVNADAGQQDYD